MSRLGPGAPSLLTPEIQALVLEALERGNYLETAAAYAGLSPSTVRSWVRRGRAALRREEQGLGYHDTERVYAAFVTAVEAAQAQAEVRDVKAIAEAAEDGDWRAAAWRLQHRHPERWGRQELRVEHDLAEGAAGRGVDLVRSLRASADGRAALEALSRGLEGLAGDDGGEDERGPLEGGTPPPPAVGPDGAGGS